MLFTVIIASISHFRMWLSHQFFAINVSKKIGLSLFYLVVHYSEDDGRVVDDELVDHLSVDLKLHTNKR